MKNLSISVLITIILSAIYSCGTNQNDEESLDDNKTSNTTEIAGKETTKATTTNVVNLSTLEFKSKVYNYDANRNWKYEGSKPCIVDFYADWCRPCKMIAPILDELSKEYDGQIVIYKIDTEKEKELASAFGINSIPSLFFIPIEGKPQLIQGALSKEKFKEYIKDILLK